MFGRTYPIPAHDSLSEAPFFPHFPHHDSQSLVVLASVLSLHPDLEHLDFLEFSELVMRAWNADEPGLARIAFAAPAIAPAAAICCRDKSGKGEMTRLDSP